MNKVKMHFNFDFSTGQILWTLTFAALLVLLVVLLGRDRAQRFPWFTASIAMMAVLLLTEQLLLSRLSRFTGTEIFLVLSVLDVAISLLVLVELARRSFRGMGRSGWIIGTLAMVAVGAAMLVFWGPWPAWKTLTATSELTTIRLMDLVVDKGILLSSLLTIELGVVITLLGRRFGAGWHSHAQRIVIGLSTAALAQLTLRVSLQAIGTHTHIHSQADYERVMDLRDKLIHGNNVAYLCVLVWWIACMWFDEPGTATGAEAETEPAEGDAAALDAPDSEKSAEPHDESSVSEIPN
ncbi:MAG: hypothetical protein WCF30_07480 [Terracidiphilus sp.]